MVTATFALTATAMPALARQSNGAPSVKWVAILGNVYTNSTFTADANGVTDPDGDAVTLHYAWLVNGVKVGSDAQTFHSTTLKGGQKLNVRVIPEDSHGAEGNPVTATARTLKWEISASEGQPAKSVPGVDIFNFGAAEIVDIRLDSRTGQILKKMKVSEDGRVYNFPLPLPWPISGGGHMLYGIGEKSHIVGQGPVMVRAAANLSPGEFAVGGTTKVTATGFRPGEKVTASFPGGASAVSKTADTAGSAAMTLTSPMVPWPGGVITVSAPSGSVQLPFRSASSIKFPVTKSEPDELLPVSLTGYGARETVEVSFQGSPTVTQKLVTRGDGSLDGQVLMATTFGAHKVIFTGATSGIVRQAAVGLPPRMTVAPTVVHVGDIVTVSSLAGWVPGETMYLYWGDTVVGVATADATGSVSTSYTVPTAGQGRVTVQLLGTVLGRYARADVHVK